MSAVFPQGCIPERRFNKLLVKTWTQFLVSKQPNRVSLIHHEYVDSEFSACTTTLKSYDQWSSEISIHHGNSTRQKDFMHALWSSRELMNALAGSVMEKNMLNKVGILFSLCTKSVLVAS